ncbi:hypothetical protein V6N13_138749 [Hibiscus sabdariffa]|uniref:Uncharacterized protein n=1 Tax=Hibiscus sabdariffa TaxID=183260 RepID=A0ABR2PK28_9ROSI
MDLLSSSCQTAIVTDDWELCNDDGFIYKREKRRLVISQPAWLPEDPEEVEKQRREWKRKNLLRVKDKCNKEIKQWEVLKNTLNSMQEKALGFKSEQKERRKLREAENGKETASFSGSENTDKEKKDNSFGSFVDEFLLRAEAQELAIRDVWNLCDIEEAICNAGEEQMKQSYFDLHVWASPRDLMAVLCDE